MKEAWRNLLFGRVQVGARVPAHVELAKEDYAVLSLPQHGAALGYAAAADFNSSAHDARPRFSAGQALTAVVAALPAPDTGMEGRGIGGPGHQVVLLVCKDI